MIVLLVCKYVVYVDVCLYSDSAVVGNALNALLRGCTWLCFLFLQQKRILRQIVNVLFFLALIYAICHYSGLLQ